MKQSVTLDEQELMELERVVMDGDGEGALKLLEEVKAKIKASKIRSCGFTAPEGGGPWPKK